MVRKLNSTKGTLFDRFAVGLLSALLALVTGIIIPMLFWAFGAVGLWPSIFFYGVLIFAVVMFFIGFFFNENLLAEIYGKIWNVIYRVFSSP